MDDVRRDLLAEREQARARLADLVGEHRGFLDASRDTNADDEHDPEGATIAFEREQVATFVRRAREHLAEVDAALERLEAGTYGVCERCGRRIDPERLAVRPAARTCVDCG
ncbi:MAG: TraR/DksA C4-type zinc finger protein [Nocardioides sp.]|nr:TraR/DksA C4-type zinc finger protein [Nocardioides sp.]